jgi:nucleotide-binding universal stress UspA family protein
MFKHLLVPTDGSELSQKTVTRAVAFAKEANARITFFYAEPEIPSAYLGLGAIANPHISQDMQARLDSAAKEILESATVQARESGVEAHHVARTGNRPWELIIETALNQGCDLIFMASHGRRGVEALLLGSETQKVLTHSSVPVLIFR